MYLLLYLECWHAIFTVLVVQNDVTCKGFRFASITCVCIERGRERDREREKEPIIIYYRQCIYILKVNTRGKNNFKRFIYIAAFLILIKSQTKFYCILRVFFVLVTSTLVATKKCAIKFKLVFKKK